MSHSARHHAINYIEFRSTNIERTKKFYSTVFGWTFKDWGPDYIDCSADASGVAIGFAASEPNDSPAKLAPLVVLYSADLSATEIAVVAAGGTIVVPTFDFPGGRRFHFSDGAGNVLGVWSE
jgi:predicted enzyme related to lactoylglutathione lyase